MLPIAVDQLIQVLTDTLPSGVAPPTRRTALKRRLVFALLLVSASASAAPPGLEPLLNSITERLAIAAQAPSYKLDPAVAEQFFAAQIEANKLVQYTRLSDWQFMGKAPDLPRPDLVGKIRPQLDQMQKRLLQQLADFAPQRNNPQCPQWVARAIHEPLHEPLMQIARARATGELCLQAPASK